MNRHERAHRRYGNVTSMRRVCLCFAFFLAVLGHTQSADNVVIDGLKWRQAGPFRGGRSIACAGVPGQPVWYMGTCGGGLWKSVNNGEDWACVTDGQLGVGTVGAIAVSPSHPDIVYIGTGEKDIRGNISHGDGVYKSIDGGKSWSHIGLKDSQTVSRIVVHPTDPSIVYAAVLGHVYGPNRERGVFKSTDGGQNWQQVLFESERAGAVDIAFDAKSPETVYAATWEAWRTPYSLNSGGPGSKLWKSNDGGKTWSDFSRKTGLPAGPLGKIGIAVSPANPKRIWALVEAREGGLFRTDDGGETWIKQSDNREYLQRAWYYMRVVADPVDPESVYILNVVSYRSKNGGQSFSMFQAAHSDDHDLWIDPSDTKRMIQSDDGGATVTVDGGQKWSQQDFPTAQFYHVSTDNGVPYRILGAQQDNSTVRMLSRGGSRGIGPNEWTSTAGGESGYVVAKPDDPDVVYGGSYGGDLSMINHRTGEVRAVDPWPDNPMGHGAIDSKFRFQWTFPIVFSPHDSRVIYTCTQHVHRSTNGGESWQVISPDLSRNDPKTLQSSGGSITQDNTSVEYYGTVFTLAESSVKRGLLWAGTDDGRVHVSPDAGKTWNDVTPKGMPKWGLCSMIEPSPHAAGTAHLAVDNHENDDLAPYLYRTTDYGKTWSLIVEGLPSRSFARVVREDPVRKDMLYCGTETGVWLSFNAGRSWQSLQNNLPIVPIHDLTIKRDDLILATHGRSFWVLDNIVSLRQSVDFTRKDAVHLFHPQAATKAGGRFGGNPGVAPGSQFAENPPTGIIIDYYLPNDSKQVQIQVKDKKGATVFTSTSAPTKKGFNRFSVNGLRYPGFRSFPGMVTWAARGGPVPAPPGDYVVHLVSDSQEGSRPLKYGKNPLSSSSEADLQEQFRFAMEIVDRVNSANDCVVAIRDIKKQLDDIHKTKPELKPDLDAVSTALTPIEEAVYQTKSRSGQDPLNYPIRLNDKLGGVLGVVLTGDFRPTKQSYDVFQILSGQLAEQETAFQRVQNGQLARLNAKLKEMGLAQVKVRAAQP